MQQEFPELTKGYFPSSLVELHKTGLDQLWHRFGGTGYHPLTRSGYDHYGADDDAMMVDQFLYDHFLKPHAGSASTISEATSSPILPTWTATKSMNPSSAANGSSSSITTTNANTERNLIMKQFRVTVMVKTIEVYQVEAENEDEAEENWADGTFIGSDDGTLDNEILTIKEVKP